MHENIHSLPLLKLLCEALTGALPPLDLSHLIESTLSDKSPFCVGCVSVTSLAYVRLFVYVPVFCAGMWAVGGSSFVILIIIFSTATTVSGTDTFPVNIV